MHNFFSTAQTSGLVVLSHTCFPECNCNMLIDAHPALMVSSDALCYNTIFEATFLYNWGFYLDYSHNILWWFVIYTDFSHPTFKHTYLKCLKLCKRRNVFTIIMLKFMPHASLMPNMNRFTSIVLPSTKIPHIRPLSWSPCCPFQTYQTLQQVIWCLPS